MNKSAVSPVGVIVPEVVPAAITRGITRPDNEDVTSEAVILFAAKLPDESRKTNALAVFVEALTCPTNINSEPL